MHVSCALPAFLLIVWAFQCFQMSDQHRNLCFSACYTGRSLEDDRNKPSDMSVRLMRTAGAISPDSFGTSLGRMLYRVAELHVLGRCRSRDFTGAAHFPFCGVNFEDVKRVPSKMKGLPCSAVHFHSKSLKFKTCSTWGFKQGSGGCLKN